MCCACDGVKAEFSSIWILAAASASSASVLQMNSQLRLCRVSRLIIFASLRCKLSRWRTDTVPRVGGGRREVVRKGGGLIKKRRQSEGGDEKGGKKVQGSVQQ